MKKILIMLLPLVIVFLMCGCQNIETIDNETTLVKTEKNEQTTSNNTEEETKETETTATETDKTTENIEKYSALVLKNGDNITSGEYIATGTDESAVEISGSNKATLKNVIINKESGNASSADDSSFEGVNAGIRAYGNSELYIYDSKVISNAKNATGVFAYDDAKIYIYDSTVTVTGGGSGGVQVAGGGTLYGENLYVTSESKAAVRSDRGGGYLYLDGGTYISNGKDGCPAIYSTAEIVVKNATLTSNNSRAVIIEGKNSVYLENCILSGYDQSTKTGSVKANVLLYQSGSGDASEGTSVFTMINGEMSANSGSMFYCTNTNSIINLTNCKLNLSSDGTLLIVSEGRWGKDGNNGGDCTLNVFDQLLEGEIIVDEISSLSMNLTNSTYTGIINSDNANATINFTLDQDSTWTLTGDSYITSFSGSYDNINSNGYSLYVNGVKVL